MTRPRQTDAQRLRSGAVALRSQCTYALAWPPAPGDFG